VATGLGFTVLHLSSSHTGGAGLSARRLSVALNEQGINSVFLALENAGFTPRFNEISYRRSAGMKTLSKVNSLLSKILLKETYFSIFSVPSMNVSDVIKIGNPGKTILHIHNWFNLLDMKSIKRLLGMGYHIVFTLHDQRLFTGGCHYSLHCTNYLENCANCPFLPIGFKGLAEINRSRMEDLLIRYKKQISVIGPSNWIVEKAKSSKAFKNIEVSHLLNHHGTLDKRVDTARQIARKNRDNLVIGVASFDKNSPLKGGKIISEVQRSLKIQNSQIEIVYLADITDSDTKNLDFWSQIDYLLVLSVADNSPNVIHEAKYFGIPIIGSNVGGIPELLDPNNDYIIESSGNQISELESLLKSIELSFKYIDPLSIQNKYNRLSMAHLRKLIKLYQKIDAQINEKSLF
jgi:glycosyltransferase involved in cell wall biosynthesis